jgi:hypothetical protein
MQLSPKLERYRILVGRYATRPGELFGAFIMPGPSGRELTMLADDGTLPESEGWEHVSVSTPKHPPNWVEMCFVKALFWAPEECVVEYHPPASSYINCHPHCLHLWRWTKGDFPMPPAELVGPATPQATIA